ncbi:PAS domain-containing protein [Devosia pacifica]|nr:PAS domain-containing protein [Devosia pacifica]
MALAQSFDWSSTECGVLEDWPECIRGSARLILGSSTPMAMLMGHEGHLLYNDAYAEFAGQRHPAIFGQRAVDAWPEIADFNLDKIARGMAGESMTLRDEELKLDRHGQLESVWMDLHYSPVLDEAGVACAVLCIAHDTTDRVLAEQALGRSEERLSLALNGSALVGTWDWDVDQDLVTADDRFGSLFGLDPLHAGLGVPLTDYFAAIHPDDRDRVQREITEALETRAPYRSEYRVVVGDKTRWVVASGRARPKPDGKGMRFPGVVVDVTEQREAAFALQESELRFRTLADTMPQMVWSTLPDGFHDYYNARWYEFTGVPAGSTDGEGWNGMFHPDDQERARQLWKYSLDTGEPYEIEYRLRHHSEQYRWTLGRALPIRDADGQIVRWFGTCTDIHDTKISAEEREIVAQELSHRIKNIFAVLNGIINLSARSNPEAKKFADALRQRILAMGEAHDLVRPHSENSKRAETQNSLQALLRRLMQPYSLDDAERLEILGEDAEIDDGAATPLALLFHELATNSAKYGALSKENGKVQVTGRLDGDDFHLEWRETGADLPPVEQINEGFGSRLMTLSVEGQMSGSLAREWTGQGLLFTSRLPVRSLRRSVRLSRPDES